MPFGFFKIQSVISGYFRHQKFHLSRQPQEVKPPTQRLWAARRQRPMCQQDVWGFPELDNSLWFHFRSYLLKVWCFFWRKERKQFLPFFSLFWNSPNFSGRSSESSTAATARRWAWKIQNRRVWLIHSPFHICFTNFVGALKTSHETSKDFLEKLLFSSMLVNML